MLGKQWIKSSLSFSNSNCVQARLTDRGEVAIRDSLTPDMSLVFTPESWVAFLVGATAGEFDLPPG